MRSSFVSRASTTRTSVGSSNSFCTSSCWPWFGKASFSTPDGRTLISSQRSGRSRQSTRKPESPMSLPGAANRGTLPGAFLLGKHIRACAPRTWQLTRPFAANALNKALEGIRFDMEPFTIHDLRRTGATHLHEQGFPPDVVEKALNHTISGVRGVYNRAWIVPVYPLASQGRAIRLQLYALCCSIQPGREFLHGTGHYHALDWTHVRCEAIASLVASQRNCSVPERQPGCAPGTLARTSTGSG